MPESSFIDHVRIHCKSGDGGAGSMHFHRDKFTTKGGPDGGDGGRGGHIIIRANRNLWTLLHLRYRKHIRAKNGVPGGSANKTGAEGEDEILEVPPGTIARRAEDNKIITEVLEHGDEKVLLSGGRGGLGNTHFKNSVNQAPTYSQPGEPGIEEIIVLELQLLADVGLVGFPNAGKSTLLSALSAAKPEAADYPFTTLKPSVGVVDYRDDKSFVMADIPGIIEDAHKGKGLGLRFLRHIERNSVLLFMVSSENLDIKKEYHTLLHELEAYDKSLLTKRRILAISKSDLLDDDLKNQLKEILPEDIPCLFISSITGNGLDELKDELWQALNAGLDLD